MNHLPKRIIVVLFLLVLVSLAAHVLADIQQADNGLQIKWDICILHAAVLLSVISIVVVSPSRGQIPDPKSSARPAMVRPPFHPPTL